MIALDTIRKIKVKEIFEKLIVIVQAIDKGSVITKAHSIGILINLTSISDFEYNAFSLLLEQLIKCELKE